MTKVKYIILLIFLQIGNQLFGQSDQLKKEIQSIALALDSLTEFKLNRSAFLDRGMGKDFELYDSLNYEYYKKLKIYLSKNESLESINSVLTKSTDILESKDIKIVQWEYIGGGTQENINKLIQVKSRDGIQVLSDNDSWTYGLYFVENAYLEFKSIKGCRTCCKEIITFKGQEIYSIEYRNEFIEQLFSYDNVANKIKIEFNDTFIEGENEEDYSILNETIFLKFNGKRFVKE